MIRLAVFALVATLATAAKVTECEGMGLPPELTGVWVGYVDFVTEAETLFNCEPTYVAFHNSTSCVYSWMEFCRSDGKNATVSVEETYSFKVSNINCTGPGAGYMHDRSLTSGMFACSRFKREGNTLTFLYGSPAEEEDAVVCPPDELKVTDPPYTGELMAELSDVSDSALEEDFFCKEED